MAELTIAFDLTEPRFRFQYVFEFEDTAVPKLIEIVSRTARNLYVTLDEYLGTCVIRAPGSLLDETPERVMEGIAAWALRLPTGHPKCLGLIGDYIAVYDFAVLITGFGTSGIGYKIHPTLRADIAGSA